MHTANGTAHGKLTTTEGVVSVSVGGSRYMDAAVVGRYPTDIAGIELSVEEARVTIGPRPDDRRADLTLCLDMDRHTMERLFYMLAAKLELPAFEEREWRNIASALLEVANDHDDVDTPERYYAEKILEAYDSGTVCDECGATIPDTPGGGLANRHHGESCSLYEANER